MKAAKWERLSHQLHDSNERVNSLGGEIFFLSDNTNNGNYDNVD